MTSPTSVTPDEARLPRLGPDDVDGKVKAVFEAFLKERGNIPNLFRIAAHRTPVFDAFRAGLMGIMGEGTVELRLKELLACRVSALNACEYCWGSHSMLARRYGATDAELASVQAGTLEGFPPAWAEALRYAETMTTQQGHVPDAQWAALSVHWTVEQLVEITAVIAAFNMFNRFANALQIPVTR